MKFSFFAIIFLWTTASNALQLEEKNNIEVYQKCHSSVVNITSITLRQDFFFDIVPQKGQGSGVIIRNDGFLVSNHHVVGQASDVEVTLHDKTQFPAKVVGSDPDSDIAVLRIQTQGKKLTPIEWGDPESLAVGQKVLAIGNPFGFGGSLSVGVISSLGRDIRAQNEMLIKDVIQTDAAINPGNSGGPLINSSGKLIGINAQIYSPSGGSAGVGFAINVKTVKRIVDQLIQFGRVQRPDLGVEGIGVGADLLRLFRMPVTHGVMVLDVADGTPAEKAGLRPANEEAIIGFRRIPKGGDIIFQLDNTKVSTQRDIYDFLVDKKVGDSITIHYVRGTTKKTASVRLTAPSRPSQGRGLRL